MLATPSEGMLSLGIDINSGALGLIYPDEIDITILKGCSLLKNSGARTFTNLFLFCRESQ
jgi:hypothetical protein